MNREIGIYAEALYSADDLHAAFVGFENQIQRLGFCGALYAYIPNVILQSDDRRKPVYQLSDSYVPNYISHYDEARYDKVDPVINAIADGVTAPFDWSGNICERYIIRNRKSREVIEESHSYGVQRGITVPLKSDQQGIAGASFIMTESSRFENPEQRIHELSVVTSMYHNLVTANVGFVGKFIRPIFGNLNDLEIRFVAGLASGKSLKEMAIELHRSKKYLEQVLMRVRVKVSGEDEDGKARINRDQLLYYAGLTNIIGQAEELRKKKRK